jgi:CrcB protein
VTLLMVTVAGAAGVAARYGLSNLFHGDFLLWVTLGINVVGSFLLGLLIVMPLAWVDPEARVALGAGFLGGFTTFSSFSVQVLVDFDAGAPGRAFVYIAASVLLGLAAAAAGFYGGRAIFP